MRAIAGSATLAVVVGLVLLAGPAAAQTAPAPSPPPAVQQRFRAHDRNGDGRIDREEYQQWMVEVFYFRDKARKGYLTLEDLSGVGVNRETFKALNRKGDGRLTLEEFVNASFRDFEAADVDKDGMLTPEEMRAYSRLTRQ